MLTTVYITQLLVDDGAVFGAYGFDLLDGSRRDENVGDSFRLAVEAGARLRDAELVQFHPSGLLEPENAAGTLAREAARGEGGVLLNNLGERFMTRVRPGPNGALHRGTASRSPPTPRSRKVAGHRPVEYGSISPTCPARPS